MPAYCSPIPCHWSRLRVWSEFYPADFRNNGKVYGYYPGPVYTLFYRLSDSSASVRTAIPRLPDIALVSCRKFGKRFLPVKVSGQKNVTILLQMRLIRKISDEKAV